MSVDSGSARRALAIVAVERISADVLAGRRHPCVVVALAGSLIGEHRYHLQRELTRFAEQGSANLVLDMSAVDEVDQLGMDAIRDTATWLEAAGCWLAMVDPSGEVRRRLRRRGPGGAVRL